MIRNENIICISSIDWNFIWQGHQEIMSTLARNGNRVLFIENTGVRSPGIRDIPRIKKRIQNWLRGIKGIRKEMDSLYVFSPLVLPFPYSWIARKINRRLLIPVLTKWTRVMDFGNPIIWVFLPTGISLDIIDNLNKKAVVYYCIAEFADLTKYPRKIKESEKKLLKMSDVVFAQGEELKKYCQTYNSNVSVFPFGVNLDVFRDFDRQDYKETPGALKDIKNPIIGYVGGLHRHLDFSLITSLAKANPGWSLVFIGPVQRDVSCLKQFNNIHILGQKTHLELPGYISRFSVSIIPYELSNYTRTVYPTKLNEYLIMGKAVVSTDLPEVRLFNKHYGDIIYVGRTHLEFSRQIKRAIEEDNGELKKRRIDVAEENSWENRIEKMSKLIEGAIERKRLDGEAGWRENLLGFYRATRRRLTRVALICLLGYLLFFKTPFIWFISSPLKIVDQPQKSDAIVVFGGGVGETGSPGKSTIERARYAVELYKQGYAKEIIFSSGYTFRYNDAENMKLFALSMGVPKENIILEQKANSTYENVKFTEQILDKNKWDTILLVTSPYNMVRASLVFGKLADKRKVICTPVPDPQFYDRKTGSRLQQIRAILHEYLGIIYYWSKRYI